MNSRLCVDLDCVLNSRLCLDLYDVMNSSLCVDLYCVRNNSLCVDIYCVTNSRLCVDLYCVMIVDKFHKFQKFTKFQKVLKRHIHSFQQSRLGLLRRSASQCLLTLLNNFSNFLHSPLSYSLFNFPNRACLFACGQWLIPGCNPPVLDTALTTAGNSGRQPLWPEMKFLESRSTPNLHIQQL